jgi:DNA primase
MVQLFQKHKTILAFVDGDRGGDLNLTELMQVSEIDFVTKAPDGKEVEELTKKEIHKSLRSKIAAEQAQLELREKKDKPLRTVNFSRSSPNTSNSRNYQNSRNQNNNRPPQRSQAPPQPRSSGFKLNDVEKKKFNKMLEDLIGTRGAYILDAKLNILGKVPYTELSSTMKSLTSGSVYAVVFDGSIDKALITSAEKINIKFLVGMSAKAKDSNKVKVLTIDNLQ